MKYENLKGKTHESRGEMTQDPSSLKTWAVEPHIVIKTAAMLWRTVSWLKSLKPTQRIAYEL